MPTPKIILKSLSGESCSCACGIEGCKSTKAKNYNPDATKDDGSCINPCGCKMGTLNTQTGEYAYQNPCVNGEDGLRAGFCPGGEEENRSPFCCPFGQAPCSPLAGCSGASGSPNFNYCSCIPVGCPEGAEELTFNLAVGSCTHNQTTTISCSVIYNAYQEQLNLPVPSPNPWSTIDLPALLNTEDLCFANSVNSANLKYESMGWAAPIQITDNNCPLCCVEVDEETVCSENCIETHITYSPTSYAPEQKTYAELNCCDSAPVLLFTFDEEISPPPNLVIKTTKIYKSVKQYKSAVQNCGTTCLSFDCSDTCTASPCPPEP